MVSFFAAARRMVLVAGPVLLLGALPDRSEVTVRLTSSRTVDPQLLFLHPGEKVEWKNAAGIPLSVVGDPDLALHRIDIEPPAPPEPFHSGVLAPGGSFRHTFALEGVYRYVCPEEEDHGMNGTIIVQRGP
jgi:plastocyanin